MQEQQQQQELKRKIKITSAENRDLSEMKRLIQLGKEPTRAQIRRLLRILRISDPNTSMRRLQFVISEIKREAARLHEMAELARQEADTQFPH